MLQFLHIFAETDFINLVLFSNTIMIMRKPFLPILLIAFGAVSALISCKGSVTGDEIDADVDLITAADVIDVGYLTDIACDFRVHRLESDGPIEGIGGIKTWGDVMFARDNNSRKVLRFDNYKLTAVLNKMGRGPGEYTYVSDFTYDEANNILSLENDSSLVMYDAKTMAFIRKQKVNLSFQNCLNVGDKALYFGYLLSDYRKPNRGDSIHESIESLILVDRNEFDVTKGKILYQEYALERGAFGYPELFYINPKNLSTCLPGQINRIVTFSEEGVKDVYRFKVGSSPYLKEVDEYVKREYITMTDLTSFYSDVMSEIRNGFRLSQVYNIMVDGDAVSFRGNYTGGDELTYSSSYLYFVHHNGRKPDTKVYRHLRIPGLVMDIDPTGANGNHQIAIIENLGDDVIDRGSEMSPLAEQIIAELKKQNDDNPVILEFRFK